MAKGKKHGKRIKPAGEKMAQSRRTQNNKRKKYQKLLDRFPKAKERDIWEKKRNGEL